MLRKSTLSLSVNYFRATVLLHDLLSRILLKCGLILSPCLFALLRFKIVINIGSDVLNLDEANISLVF